MKPRIAVLLSLAGILALAGAWYFSRPAVPGLPAAPANALAFPRLADTLRNATRIEITSKGKTLKIVRKGDDWGIAERGFYPVQMTRLRGLFSGLTELRLTEMRTADPAEYARIGVEDPKDKDSTSTLLRVLDAKDAPLAEMILGHRRVRTSGNLPEAIDVRRPDEAQAWLAEGRVEADADPQAWFDRDLIDIPNRKISGVTVSRGEEHLVFARSDDRLSLVEPAEHPPLDPIKLEDVGRALESLTFTDVRPAKQSKPIGHSVFTADDGLRITATLAQDGADLWAHFTIAGDGAARDEASRLGKLAAWDYQIGAWKEKSLLPLLADLIAPAKPAP